jgi:cytochrome c2
VSRLRRSVLALSVLALPLAACGSAKQTQLVPGADPERGKTVIEDVGCGACHAIPGIRSADGRVGPPLDDFGRRRTVAGKLPNTPRALTHWIRFPQAVVPGNDMPNLRLSRRDARDVAAYLLQRT